MSGFSFRFQKILDLKENEKTFAQLQMAGALKREQDGLERKAAIAGELRAAEEMEREKQQRGVAISELRSLELYKQQLHEQSLSSSRELRKLQQEADNSRKFLGEKAKEEQVWEKLKENERMQFQHEQKVKEQNFFDELASIRFYRMANAARAERE